MDFEIIGQIRDIEPIVVGRGIRNLARLRKQYGKGRWRKMKGVSPPCVSKMARFTPLKSIGMKHMVLARKNSN